MVDARSNRSAAKSSHRATMSNAFAPDVAENNEDARSRATSLQSRLMTPQKPAQTMDQGDYPEVHLVPCRWKRTGWKYANVSHGNQFFRSPNRQNSTGYSQFEKNFGNTVLPGSAYPKREYDEGQRFSNTSYSTFFHK